MYRGRLCHSLQFNPINPTHDSHPAVLCRSNPRRFCGIFMVHSFEVADTLAAHGACVDKYSCGGHCRDSSTYVSIKFACVVTRGPSLGSFAHTSIKFSCFVPCTYFYGSSVSASMKCSYVTMWTLSRFTRICVDEILLRCHHIREHSRGLPVSAHASTKSSCVATL